ncbi:hypothetical protein niasHS_001405 [Heterodera schachtii]|uniref:Uncharacterized protein n=1 Tax=Heterodera schachtii TaxID=97005 RepID=A0ABD2KE64_HETSC
MVHKFFLLVILAILIIGTIAEEDECADAPSPTARKYCEQLQRKAKLQRASAAQHHEGHTKHHANFGIAIGCPSELAISLIVLAPALLLLQFQ